MVAAKNKLGWSLQGKCGDLSATNAVNLILCGKKSLSTELRCFWELENLSIVDKKKLNV